MPAPIRRSLLDALRRHAPGRRLTICLTTAVTGLVMATSAIPARATMPASTTSGIHLALPFNNSEPIVNGTVQGEAGVVNYVWGAVGDPGNIPGGTAWHETYFPWGRDGQDRPLSWFVANHPTWVMYMANRHTPATLFGDPTPMLDTTNPQVQAWIETQEEALLGGGFQGVSWDNGIVYNESHAVGHFDANGQWVQQYTGVSYDVAYANAQTAAFAAVTGAIKALYPNASDTLNQPFSCDSIWSLPLPSTTMILDEQGFTNYGEAEDPYITSAAGDGCTNDWLQRVQEYVTLQRTDGKGLVLLNEEPYQVSSYITDTNLRARADLQWALANYLLVKYSHTYFWWGGTQQYGGPAFLEREYSAPIGSPTDDVHPAQGVYMRDYTGGLAIVNPDPTQTRTISLGSGYRDLYGHAVTQLVMGPHSGSVLLDSGIRSNLRTASEHKAKRSKRKTHRHRKKRARKARHRRRK
jgi:hypothetical protein